MKRTIAQLHYELEHPKQITEDEIIKSLALEGHEFGGVRSGHLSDKTRNVAMNYKDIGQRMNSDLLTQIASELQILEAKAERLEHYVSLLDEQQSKVIRMWYFEEKQWKEIVDEVGGNRRSLSDTRSAGINALVEMYGYLEDLTSD
jgi:DNA-directed RNA polymerase specialized sigma subunit